MVEVVNYFNVLMKEFGFESINEDFVKFLKRHINKSGVVLNYRFNSIWPEQFLKSHDQSPVAYEIFGEVVLKGLDYKEVDPSILYDETVPIGPIYYTSILKNGEIYCPAYKKDIPILPIKLSEGVYEVGVENAKPFFEKLPSAPLKTENIFLTRQNYEKFKFQYELDRASKTPAKRRIMLKAFLEHDGYDTRKKLLSSEHTYANRQELWQMLNAFNPKSKLFPPTSKSTIDKFFDGNPYISFDKSKKI